jgi:hypothetical protein
MISGGGRNIQNLFIWDLSITDVALVDGWRDNHVLIFYTNCYYRYSEHTNEFQLEDLKVAGSRRSPFC